MTLPWTERVPMLSINPDAASREDIARLAADLMEAHGRLDALEAEWTVCPKCQHRVPTNMMAVETKDGAPIDDVAGFMWGIVCHGRRVLVQAWADRDALAARVRALEAALRQVEWTDGSYPLPQFQLCLWCRENRLGGHAPDCPRQRALAAPTGGAGGEP